MFPNTQETIVIHIRNGQTGSLVQRVTQALPQIGISGEPEKLLELAQRIITNETARYLARTTAPPQRLVLSQLKNDPGNIGVHMCEYSSDDQRH